MGDPPSASGGGGGQRQGFVQARLFGGFMFCLGLLQHGGCVLTCAPRSGSNTVQRGAGGRQIGGPTSDWRASRPRRVLSSLSRGSRAGRRSGGRDQDGFWAGRYGSRAPDRALRRAPPPNCAAQQSLPPGPGLPGAGLRRGGHGTTGVHAAGGRCLGHGVLQGRSSTWGPGCPGAPAGRRCRPRWCWDTLQIAGDGLCTGASGVGQRSMRCCWATWSAASADQAASGGPVCCARRRLDSMSTTRFSSRERDRLCISSSSWLRAVATCPRTGPGSGGRWLR